MDALDEIRNENGYVKLDEVKELYKNGKYTKKIHVKRVNSNKIQMEINSEYNELIAEELAKDFGLKTAHYDIGILPSKERCCFSEDFTNGKFAIDFLDFMYDLKSEYENSDKYYTKAYSITLIRNMLNDFPDNIDERSLTKEEVELFNKYKRKLTEDEIENIIDYVNRIYIFDMLIANTDNNIGNFGFILDEKGAVSMPCFDNEMLLGSAHNASYSLCLDYYQAERQWYGKIKEPNEMAYYYFEESNEEYFKLFQDKLWIISEENIESVFKRVEERTKSKIDEEIKNEYREAFRKNNENLYLIEDNLKMSMSGFSDFI